MKHNSILIVLGVVFLFLIAACGEDGNIVGGAPTTPFLGGSEGLEIGFLDGNPPREVTDGDTFPFQAVITIKNQGEFSLLKNQVEVSLIGFLPDDFGWVDDPETDEDERDELISVNPDDDLNSKRKNSEGVVVEAVDTFVAFPNDADSFSFKGKIPGNTVFIFRADVCYAYQTDALSEICILENLVDVGVDSICDPSETKTVFSSGSPVQIENYAQNVAGKNKIQFSFDIVHSGQGTLFKPDTEGNGVDCPKDPSLKRRSQDRVILNISTGLGNTAADVEAETASLKCVGLDVAENGKDVTGLLTLVDGRRTVTCTQNLEESRTDFKKNININVAFNYLTNVDKEVLVKHLADES